jgi:hypothetical protein
MAVPDVLAPDRARFPAHGPRPTADGQQAEGRARRAALDPRLIPFAIFAVVAAVTTWAVSPYPVGVFQDDGIYVVLAKALASGQGYRYLHLPGAPAATHYPPGYPALLALLWKLSPAFPQNLALFKFVNAGLVALACAVAYRFAERRLALSTPAAATVAVAGGVAIPTLVVSGMVLSEPLFLALLVPALIVAERLADPAERPTVARALGVGALAGLLVLVRTVGFVLVPAACLALVVRHRADVRRALAAALAVGAGALAVVLPWQLYVWRHAAVLPPELQGKYGSYSGWLAEGFRQDGPAFALSVIGENARQLFWMTRMLFAFRLPLWWQAVAAVVVVALLALGLARARRVAPVTALFTLAYLGIVFLWPFPPARFVFGIGPIVIALVALGVAALAAWRPSAPRARPLRPAALTLSALALLGSLSYFVSGYRDRFWDSIPRQRTPAATAAVQWVADHAGPRDVVASDEETMVWLYAGRQGVPTGSFTAMEYLREPGPAELAASLRGILRAYPVDWFLASTKPAQEAAERMLYARPPELRLVDTIPPGIAVFSPVRP